MPTKSQKNVPKLFQEKKKKKFDTEVVKGAQHSSFLSCLIEFSLTL